MNKKKNSCNQSYLSVHSSSLYVIKYYILGVGNWRHLALVPFLSGPRYLLKLNLKNLKIKINLMKC